MQILDFSVSNQILSASCPGRLVVSQTRGHLFAQVALDHEWDGLSVTAVFSNDFARKSYQRILTADPVEVPEEVLVPGRLFVSLVGLGDGGAVRLTTKRMDKPIVVYRAGDLVGLTPEETTPELWEQAMSAIGRLDELQTSDKSSLVAAINAVFQSGGGGSVDPDAIAQAVADYMAAHPIQETDPTVPAWAKQPKKPSYTASEVGADPSGTAASQVSTHNTGTDTHSDIRLLIQGLTDRLNALADSDDTTLDQLSEVVAYIKSNRTLIEAITTNKVSVADIIDNLTTNVSNKPLSAAQGVALKALIDAISIPDKLPNPNALTFTGAATGSYDGSAPVSVEIPSGGGGGAEREWSLLGDIDISTFGGGSIELTGLDNFTEFYVTWGNVINESETASGYNLSINGVNISNHAVPIAKSGTTTYGWTYARYNGLIWEIQKSAGAVSQTNITVAYLNANFPYNHLFDVGTATELLLTQPLPAYVAVSGNIKIYGR